MLELSYFHNFARLEALGADADPFRGAVNERPDGPQVWQESARIYTGYLLPDAALFLGEPSAYNGSAGDRFFAANLALLGHFFHLMFSEYRENIVNERHISIGR